MMRIEDFPFAEVAWGDAWSISSWMDPENIELKAKPMISRGWVWKATDDVIVLFSSVDKTNGDISEIIVIPKGMVEDIRYLRGSFPA